MQEHLEAGGEFILLGIIIIVMYQVTVRLYRKWRRSKVGYTHVSIEEIEEQMQRIPAQFRSSARHVQCSYELFSGRDVRFTLYKPQPWENDESDVICLRAIIDQKLCLFFYKDKDRENSWKYDGFEAGDYSTVFTDGRIA